MINTGRRGDERDNQGNFRLSSLYCSHRDIGKCSYSNRCKNRTVHDERLHVTDVDKVVTDCIVEVDDAVSLLEKIGAERFDPENKDVIICHGDPVRENAVDAVPERSPFVAHDKEVYEYV